MIDNNLLIAFTQTNSRNLVRAPKTLESALMDSDIINFLNKNNIEFESPIDGLKIACILGLIKNCLQLDIHVIGEKTIAGAFGIINDRTNVGFYRFDRWLKSDTLFSFYENTISLLKTIHNNKLKINALTIVDDVMMLQSRVDGEDYNKKPLDRFSVRESMLREQTFSFDEKIITPEMVLSARTTANLTQKEAAALVYVDERSWQRWESGDRKMNRNVYELFLIKTGIIA
jgi:hypothetical protein